MTESCLATKILVILNMVLATISVAMFTAWRSTNERDKKLSAFNTWEFAFHNGICWAVFGINIGNIYPILRGRTKNNWKYYDIMYIIEVELCALFLLLSSSLMAKRAKDFNDAGFACSKEGFFCDLLVAAVVFGIFNAIGFFIQLGFHVKDLFANLN